MPSMNEVTNDLLRDPNKIKWFYCYEKGTKNLVALESKKDFSAKHYDLIPGTSVAAEMEATDPDVTEEDKALFLGLKARGFRNLSGSERKLYTSLKTKLGL